MLEIDGHLIRTEKAVSVILRDRIGRITLAMIAVEPTTTNDPTRTPTRLKSQVTGRLRQARDLFAKVCDTRAQHYQRAIFFRTLHRLHGTVCHRCFNVLVILRLIN